jgi:hypothetical protein
VARARLRMTKNLWLRVIMVGSPEVGMEASVWMLTLTYGVVPSPDAPVFKKISPEFDAVS